MLKLLAGVCFAPLGEKLVPKEMAEAHGVYFVCAN